MTQPPASEKRDPAPSFSRPIPQSWQGRVALIGGPTGVGKTEATLLAAVRWSAEVIVADSMQVYCGLELGTAKPAPEQRARAAHHMIDVVPFDRLYSARLWLEGARREAAAILDRGRRVLVSGGTGLYLKAFVLGFSGRGIDNDTDPRLRTRLEKMSPADRLRELLARDPEAGRWIDVNNPRRVTRALEQVVLTGIPLAELRGDWARPESWPAGIPVWNFDLPDEELRRRQHRRLERMLSEGWVEEVRQLVDRGFGPGLTSYQALGYRRIARALEDRQKPDIEALRQRIATDTWQFARRQRSWFSGQLPATRCRPWERGAIPSW